MHRHSIYLSGSIEFNKDPDSWRVKMMHALKHKYNVIIPWDKACPFEKDEPEIKHFAFNEYVIPDMTAVAGSKYTFVMIDKGVLKGAGTKGEVSLAAFFGRKIVYMITDGVKEEELPVWFLGCLYKAHRVTSVEEAIDYFKHREEI